MGAAFDRDGNAMLEMATVCVDNGRAFLQLIQSRQLDFHKAVEQSRTAIAASRAALNAATAAMTKSTASAGFELNPSVKDALPLRPPP